MALWNVDEYDEQEVLVMPAYFFEFGCVQQPSTSCVSSALVAAHKSTRCEVNLYGASIGDTPPALGQDKEDSRRQEAPEEEGR